METIVMSIPTLPDRTACLLGRSNEGLLDTLIHYGNQLKSLGAQLLSMPCITAQYFREDIVQAVGIPMVDPVLACINQLRINNVYRVGLMATTGTVKIGTVQNCLKTAQIETIFPSQQDQEALMHLIYRQIKAGQPGDVGLLNRLCKNLKAKGAEVILLGCTELSLMKAHLEGKILDLLEVLARESVIACGKPLRNCYESLLGG